MKKRMTVRILAVATLAVVLTSGGRKDNNEVMTREDGMTVVNTTTLCKDVMGYMDNTPLKIYIKKNKVERIEALRNQETPKYFAKVKKQLLDKWNGKKVGDALKLQVDGVTGATMSSNAVKANVRAGLEYYKQHR